MDDPTRVRVGERRRDREGGLRGLLPREGPVPRHVPEVRALDELHHEERRLTVLAVLVETDDVRVLERSENARLTGEAAPELEILDDPRVEQLDRHVPVQAPVTGAPDRAHPPFADATTQLVAAGNEAGQAEENACFVAESGACRPECSCEPRGSSCKEKEKSRSPGIPFAVKPLYTVTTSFPRERV